MAKYRIKEETNRNGDKKFIPQMRVWVIFFPGWVGWSKPGCSPGSGTTRSFETLEAAKSYIHGLQNSERKSKKYHKV